MQEEPLVSRDGGVHFVQFHAGGVFPLHYPDGAGGVFVDVVVFGRVDDARLVYGVQPVGDGVHVFWRQSGQPLLEVIPEFGYHRSLLFLVVVVVGLEKPHQRVFLFLDGLVGLVDGEIIFGYERAIHPWLADVVAEGCALVAGQYPNDDDHGHQHQYDFRGEYAPVVFRAVEEDVHAFDGIRGFILRKYKKKHHYCGKICIFAQNLSSIRVFTLWKKEK